LNYLVGFWQADPIVGLIIMVFLFKEGIGGLKESRE
jgi:divalent metal cation (Fe/Co/Zn/Cd) transporter